MDIKELLLGESARLSRVRRYSSMPVNRGETVAEHSFYVAYYSLIIAEDLLYQINGIASLEEATARGESFVVTEDFCELDWRKVLGSALLHDITESMTGDILRQVKHDNSDILVAFGRLESKIVNFIEEKIKVKFSPLFYAAKDESLEGRIVAIGDAFSVVSYTIEEYLTGNVYLLRVLEEIRRDHIVRLKDSIETTMKLRDGYPAEAIRIILRKYLEELDTLIGEYLDKEPNREELIRYVTRGEKQGEETN